MTSWIFLALAAVTLLARAVQELAAWRDGSESPPPPHPWQTHEPACRWYMTRCSCETFVMWLGARP